MGGWISTRASGMKKNIYGNIEDMVQNIKIVTSIGTITKLSNWPRISNGPDLNHLILGHEGNMGLVTEAVVRLRPVPEVTEYESVVFPDYEHGMRFIEAVAKSRIWPASMRVIDEKQLGAAWGAKEEKSIWGRFLDSAAEFYLTKIKGFDFKKMAAGTIMFEGSKEEVARQRANINRLYPKFGGILGGSENGMKGY